MPKIMKFWLHASLFFTALICAGVFGEIAGITLGGFIALVIGLTILFEWMYSWH
jgi:hypothetical protein